MDLALNNHQWLICHKTNQTKTNYQNLLNVRVLFLVLSLIYKQYFSQ